MADHAAALPPPSAGDATAETAAKTATTAATTAADEADFAAISAVLRGTARGRWFLEELWRRHRNADTVMVLDAVARIEAALAPQPATPAAAAPPHGLRTDLAQLVDDGRTLLTQAHNADSGTARAALGIIRDVSRMLRECGADIRICDVLDQQADAIDAGFATPLADIAEAAAILDKIKARLATTDPSVEPCAAAPAVITAPGPALPALPDIPTAPAATSRTTPAAPSIAAPAPAAPRTTTPAEPAVPPDDPAPSLGAAILANGTITLPAAPEADSFAAFRRMTPAEQVAFFS